MALRATCSEGGEDPRARGFHTFRQQKAFSYSRCRAQWSWNSNIGSRTAKKHACHTIRRLPPSSYAVFLRRRKVLVHSPSAGSAALAHHLSSTAVTLVPVVIICSTENPKE